MAHRLERRSTLPEEVIGRYSIASFFCPNIPESSRSLQRLVFDKFGHKVDQFSEPLCFHSSGLEWYVENHPGTDYFLFFDIDCVPVSEDAIPSLLGAVSCGRALAGAAQQASHLRTGHEYASPACLALPRLAYEELGSPSFHATRKSDVAEAITLAAEAAGMPVSLMRPTSVELERWKLGDGKFGYGTTYDDLVYHAFGACWDTASFDAKCRSILGI